MDSKSGIAKYAKTSKKVGADNARKVALWTYKWGWTTELVLQKLIGVTRRPAANFVNRGVLEKVIGPRGHPPAYLISPAWMIRAQGWHEEHGRMEIAIPPPRATVPFAALGEHQEKAQIIALGQLADLDGDMGRITTDREMIDAQTGARPDFQLLTDSGMEWHEVELAPKYAERLFLQLQGRDEARRDGRFGRIVWWCGTLGIARNLMLALSQERIPRVIRRADGRVVRLPGEEGWSPAKLLAASEILLLGDRRGTDRQIIPAKNPLTTNELDSLAVDL